MNMERQKEKDREQKEEEIMNRGKVDTWKM